MFSYKYWYQLFFYTLNDYRVMKWPNYLDHCCTIFGKNRDNAMYVLSGEVVLILSCQTRTARAISGRRSTLDGRVAVTQKSFAQQRAPISHLSVSKYLRNIHTRARSCAVINISDSSSPTCRNSKAEKRHREIYSGNCQQYFFHDVISRSREVRNDCSMSNFHIRGDSLSSIWRKCQGSIPRSEMASLRIRASVHFPPFRIL